MPVPHDVAHHASDANGVTAPQGAIPQRPRHPGFGLAVGYTGTSSSPFVFCVVAAIAVAAFGWGYMAGFLAISVGWMAMAAGAAVSPGRDAALGALFDSDAAAVLVTMAALTFLSAFGRTRLVENEQRRRRLAGRIDTLAETNDLLTMLNSVARTLPTSLNQREALESARVQIATTFRPSAVCLMERAENYDEWTPKLAEGCAVAPSHSTGDLPEPLRWVVGSGDPTLFEDLSAAGIAPIAPGSTSGLYTRLVARNRTIGVLGIESASPGAYRERDRRLLSGLADFLALTLDNARWFGRLRSLGAEEERNRIARDLHDRLGQWLTYISFELERIILGQEPPSPDLEKLQDDVRSALDELRDTLSQLRSEVSEERPLALVGKELVTRFANRADIPATWRVVHPGLNLPIPIENELLRILQESLSNIDKHAAASAVNVTWDVFGGAATLTVADDGQGFDAARGVRDSAYGLVGMRERADTIGARLMIDTTPGAGTVVTVHVGSMETDKDGA